MRIALISLLALFGMINLASAQAAALTPSAWQAVRAAKPEGDAAVGQTLFAEKGCGACHGEQGIPSNKEWPVLAGQRPVYTYKMLLDYRDNRLGSTSPMTAIASGLTEQDMAHLATWLGELRRPASPGLSGAVPPVAKGDRERLIPPCEACHGANGQGWDLQPAIAGQNKAYLVSVLNRFKSGERANDINNGMAQFARKLHDDEIRQLSVFYGR